MAETELRKTEIKMCRIIVRCLRHNPFEQFRGTAEIPFVILLHGRYNPVLDKALPAPLSGHDVPAGKQQHGRKKYYSVDILHNKKLSSAILPQTADDLQK